MVLELLYAFNESFIRVMEEGGVCCEIDDLIDITKVFCHSRLPTCLQTKITLHSQSTKMSNKWNYLHSFDFLRSEEYKPKAKIGIE